MARYYAVAHRYRKRLFTQPVVLYAYRIDVGFADILPDDCGPEVVHRVLREHRMVAALSDGHAWIGQVVTRAGTHSREEHVGEAEWLEAPTVGMLGCWPHSDRHSFIEWR